MNLCISALFVRSHGILRYGTELVRHLSRIDGNRICIDVVIHQDIRSHFQDLEESGNVRIRVVNIRFKPLRFLYFHCIFPFQLRGYDLFHSIGNIGLVFCPIPQCLSVMDTYERLATGRFNAVKKMLMSLFISRSTRQAKRIIAISRNTAGDVERYYGIPRDKIDVVYLGNTFIDCKAQVAGSRRDFLFVGTVEPGKNLATALQALKIYRERGGSRRLRIVGATGLVRTNISQEIQTLNIADAVSFAGYVPNSALAEEYAAAFAFIFPSRYEGFGLPVIEAMACGCPVIAARNSAIVEAGGDAALYFETMDPADLASKMNMLELDDGLVSQMVLKGRAHAAGFTWEKTAAESLLVYRRILGQS